MLDLDKTLELLARDVFEEIKNFYSNPENLEKYKEWKNRIETQGSDT